MPETSPAIDPLRLPAFTHALDAGHAAAAAGQWSAAAARFSDALAAVSHDGGAPDAHAAVALSNLGQALARVGRWDDAEDALRRAAHARDALVHAGLGAPSVAARGWSDVAALLAAAGPEDAARAALAHARSLLTGADDAAVLAALDETAALVGVAPDDAPLPDALVADAPATIALLDDDAEPFVDTTDDAQVATRVEARDAAPLLDLPMLAEDATASDAEATAGVDESIDAAWRPTPVFDAEPLEVDGPDLDALLALAAGPPEPEPPTVELDGGDSLADALDAAIEWAPTAEATAAPADAIAASPHASVDAPDDEDDLDAEPELLTPGVDLADLQDVQLVPSTTGRARGADPGAGRGQRLAAIEAIVELTEERQAPRGGGLRGLLRRLTGR
ncbi:MAG: tetratricopeptide repeat protein [Gemmatirosa sp.]